MLSQHLLSTSEPPPASPPPWRIIRTQDRSAVCRASEASPLLPSLRVVSFHVRPFADAVFARYIDDDRPTHAHGAGGLRSAASVFPLHFPIKMWVVEGQNDSPLLDRRILFFHISLRSSTLPRFGAVLVRLSDSDAEWTRYAQRKKIPPAGMHCEMREDAAGRGRSVLHPPGPQNPSPFPFRPSLPLFSPITAGGRAAAGLLPSAGRPNGRSRSTTLTYFS